MTEACQKIGATPDERRTTAPSSISSFTAIFIITNAALGVGTLNFPEAFASSGGLMASIPILIFSGIMCGLSLGVCALANWESGEREFYQAVRFYAGGAQEALFHLTLILAYVGTCTMYMVTVGDQSDEIVVRIFGKDTYCDSWFLDRKITITVLSTLVILPLCLAKSLEFLKYPSLLAVLSMLYLTSIIVVDYFLNGATNQAQVDKVPEDLVGLFNAFPTMVLGYQCMSNGYSVFGLMASPTPFKYSLSIVGSVAIMTFIYFPVATCGYLRNGRKSKTKCQKMFEQKNCAYF
ncbi:sodium-coupled neutral amino acid transporter 7-like [Symsagittifera roscoffensis]|uniref:sodium-coupled neutral amino acid transporter 7-like n=1 Tax=Symsagittifera roscoffensis TaxID=84072 RepID=UPI00307BEF1C